MVNDPVITNIDVGSVLLDGKSFQDDTLTLAGAGAVTYAAGTILARNTATGKLIAFVKGGVADGNGIPITVLTDDYTIAAAGDLPVRVLNAGIVRFEKLIILADGDNSNVDSVVKDAVNGRGIIIRTVLELNIQDNQ